MSAESEQLAELLNSMDLITALRVDWLQKGIVMPMLRGSDEKTKCVKLLTLEGVMVDRNEVATTVLVLFMLGIFVFMISLGAILDHRWGVAVMFVIAFLAFISVVIYDETR